LVGLQLGQLAGMVCNNILCQVVVNCLYDWEELVQQAKERNEDDFEKVE